MKRSVNHVSTIVKYIAYRGILPFKEEALFDLLYKTMALADAYATKGEAKAEVTETYNKNARIKEPVEVIKLIDSLMYACSSWPPFHRSQAFFILSFCRECIVPDIPQYRVSEWAIE